MTQKLRVGLLLPQLPFLLAWQRACLEHMLSTGKCELVAACETGAGEAESGAWLAQLLLPLVRRRPAADLLVCKQLRWVDDRAAMAELTELHLDVLLDFGRARVTPDLSSTARFGVWTYQHGMTTGLTAPYSTEFLRKEAAVHAALIAAHPRGNAVIQEGTFRMQPSWQATCGDVLGRTAAWVALALGRIIQRGLPECSTRLDASAPRRSPAMTLLGIPILGLGRRLAYVVEDLVAYDVWNIGIARICEPVLDSLAKVSAVEWLPEAGPMRFMADPFWLRAGEHPELLAESFDYRRDKPTGVIVHISLDGARKHMRTKDVLQAEWHLSYPCVVEDGDALYCVPEAIGSGRIERFVVDGDALHPDGVLLPSFAGCDPTVFRYGSLWWLLCGGRGREARDTLYAFYASAMEGPWQPHALNPVKVDVSNARPAGKPFAVGDRLYRPAQDCSRVYGGAVVLNEVDVLTTQDFHEHPVLRMSPDVTAPYSAGVHHLDLRDGWLLIDAKKRVFDPLFRLKRRRPNRK